MSVGLSVCHSESSVRECKAGREPEVLVGPVMVAHWLNRIQNGWITKRGLNTVLYIKMCLPSSKLAAENQMEACHRLDDLVLGFLPPPDLP